MYTRDTVADVLSATDIVQLVGARIELQGAGRGRRKACCPFHQEKTPSFFVSETRQTFHCFGCGKGGDAIAFLVEYDGVTFVEALRMLAERAGIRLPTPSPAEDRRQSVREQLLAINGLAAQFFQHALRDSAGGAYAREYLKKRDLKEETVKRFGLGFAPDNWTALYDNVRQRNIAGEAIAACGLFRQSSRGSGWYDFFRNRLIFPMRDLAGNIVAFGGRALDDSPAKYINSPETDLYRKSRVLYGLHEARDALRKSDWAFLVEGYIDLMRCFDAGIENVVATCGTALTEEQATLIRRYVPEVVVVYDGDRAGIQAALKASGILSKAGLTVRVMTLPDNQDPDDFIRQHGTEAFTELAREAPDFVAFHVSANRERARTIEGRAEVARDLFAVLEELDDALRIEEYLKAAARGLGLNEWALRSEYHKHVRRKGSPPSEASPEPAEAPSYSKDDCDFVAVLLAHEDLRQDAAAALAELALPPGPLREVLERLLAEDAEGTLRDLESDAARRLYAQAASAECPEREDAQKLVRMRTNRLRRDVLRQRESVLREAIQEAEHDADWERVAELMVQQLQLRNEMEKIGAA